MRWAGGDLGGVSERGGWVLGVAGDFGLSEPD